VANDLLALGAFRVLGHSRALRAFCAPHTFGRLALACAATLLIFALPAEAAGPSVGMVTKVQNDGTVVTDGSAVSAKVGTVVHMQDSIKTGADSRLEITFKDGTKVTLSDNANIVVDKYVFNPAESVGEASLNVTEGAFRFVTGRMHDMTNKSVTVTTTAAQIGVRGTNFWAGSLGKYGVYLFSGGVDVTAAGSTVALAPGQGTFIALGGAPGAAGPWSAAQLAEILQTVTFGPPGGTQPQKYQQQQNQQQQQQQQTTNTTTTPPTYALVPVIAGGAVVGAFVWSSNADNNDNKGHKKKPASP
jgi:hypothetical protein